MRLKGYDEGSGRRVWLGRDEVALFLSEIDKIERQIALGFGIQCGLRTKEILGVTVADIVEDDIVGSRVRVENAKGGWYREVPMPTGLKTTAKTYANVRDLDPDEPLVDRSRRSVQRWTISIAEQCQEETGDAGWSFLRPHDLRRTWGTLLVEAGVEPGMIMEWGGWKNWDTFREHYLGAYSPDMEKKQAALVPWLDVDGEPAERSDPNDYMSINQSHHAN